MTNAEQTLVVDTVIGDSCSPAELSRRQDARAAVEKERLTPAFEDPFIAKLRAMTPEEFKACHVGAKAIGAALSTPEDKRTPEQSLLVLQHKLFQLTGSTSPKA
jgi:hypothetical protein